MKSYIRNIIKCRRPTCEANNIILLGHAFIKILSYKAKIFYREYHNNTPTFGGYIATCAVVYRRPLRVKYEVEKLGGIGFM